MTHKSSNLRLLIPITLSLRQKHTHEDISRLISDKMSLLVAPLLLPHLASTSNQLRVDTCQTQKPTAQPTNRPTDQPTNRSTREPKAFFSHVCAGSCRWAVRSITASRLAPHSREQSVAPPPLCASRTSSTTAQRGGEDCRLMRCSD